MENKQTQQLDPFKDNRTDEQKRAAEHIGSVLVNDIANGGAMYKAFKEQYNG